MRRHNLSLVLQDIAAHDRPTRAQVAARTGLTKATVSALVEALAGAGLVAEGDPGKGSVGRPGSPLGLDPAGPAGLGVEINVDYVAACLVDFTGAVRHRRVVARDHRGRPVADVVDDAVAVADAVVSASARDGLTPHGLGVAVPGLVDLDGVLRRAPNLPGWEGVAVAERIGTRLARPLDSASCDNEANAAALAELWHSGDPVLGDFVHVSGEIGVGAGIVVDGHLWRGVRGMSGELGHVSVEPDGPECSCGARGCLEQFAGQEALLRAAGLSVPAMTALGDSAGSTRELVRLAAAGDGATRAALARAATALGTALAALVNLVDVPAVVLGGIYADLSPWLVEPVASEMHRRVVGHVWSPTSLTVSRLGADAAVLGAATSVVRAVLADPAEGLVDALVV